MPLFTVTWDDFERMWRWQVPGGKYGFAPTQEYARVRGEEESRRVGAEPGVAVEELLSLLSDALVELNKQVFTSRVTFDEGLRDRIVAALKRGESR